jgi:hypothetical protein
MYFSAIGFIYDVKKGPFWEHSPILYDISGVKAGWAKINKVRPPKSYQRIGSLILFSGYDQDVQCRGIVEIPRRTAFSIRLSFSLGEGPNGSRSSGFSSYSKPAVRRATSAKSSRRANGEHPSALGWWASNATDSSIILRLFRVETPPWGTTRFRPQWSQSTHSRTLGINNSPTANF